MNLKEPSKMQRIAKAAGVHVSTVSRVLNGAMTRKAKLAHEIAKYTGKSPRNYMEREFWPLLNNKRRKSA